MPSAPACASISDDRDRRSRRDAELGGRVGGRLRRRARPARARCVPMRANPSSARSPSPIASKYDGSQRRSWPRYVHLHTVVHSERSVAPGRPPRQVVGEVEPVRGAAPRVGAVALQPAQLRRLHLGRDRPADELQHADDRSRRSRARRRSRGDPSRRRRSVRSSPSTLTDTGRPSASIATSEHVASKPMPTTASGAIDAAAIAARVA